MKKHFLALAVVLMVAATSSLSALTINEKYIGDIEVGADFGLPFDILRGRGDNHNFIPLEDDYIQLDAGINVGYYYDIVGLVMKFDWGFTAKQPEKINNVKVDSTKINTFSFKLAPSVKILKTDSVNIKANIGFVFGNVWANSKIQEMVSKSSTPIFFGLGAGLDMNFNIGKTFYISLSGDLNFNFTGKTKTSVEGNGISNDAKEHIYGNAICVLPKIGVGFRF